MTTWQGGKPRFIGAIPVAFPAVFIFHFHTRGMDDILCKILDFNFVGKSSHDQREHLIAHLQNQQPRELRHLTKFILVLVHSRAHIIPPFELHLARTPESCCICTDDLLVRVRSMLVRHGVDPAYYESVLRKEPWRIYLEEPGPNNENYDNYQESVLGRKGLIGYILDHS